MKLQELISFDPSLKIIKNPEWPNEIWAISALNELQQNSFIFIKNAKFFKTFIPQIEQAAAIELGAVVDEKLLTSMDEDSKKLLLKLPWLITSPNVALSLTILSKPFYDLKMKGLNTQVDGRQMGTTEINPSAYISQNVFIGENVKIGANVEILPGCVILPHVEIGDNTKIYPNVVLYPFTKVGRNCRIHGNTVIGADGFGYTFNQGQHQKIWHMGGVTIHDDVEIGANSAVDGGTFSPTIVGPGCRIDNFVQIAHNCKLGRGCIVCGHTGLAGSVTLEDYVVLAGAVGVGPDAYIGKGSQVAGGSKVNDGAVVPPGSKLGGHPARDLREWMKGVAYLRKESLKDRS